MSAHEKSNRGLLIAIIALLAALVIGVIVLIIVLLSRNDNTQTQMPIETTVITAADTTISVENTQLVTDNVITIDTTESASMHVETPAYTIDVRPVFQEVLQSIHDNHEYGDAVFEPLNPEDTDIGQFAIDDFDGDGKEELLVLWNDTYMAAMVGILYGVKDTGEMFVEHWCLPFLRIYRNGIIEQDISHNQGLAGAFWPYYYARYNSATDTFEAVGGVDAWDRSLAKVDYDGNSYPEYADTSHSGIVYYINDPSYEKDGQPVDVTEYEAWHQNLLNGSDEIRPDLKTITNQEIQAIVS